MTMLEQILIHSNTITIFLLSISGLLFFISIIQRLKDLRELVVGLRRMQGIVVEMERTVNELQAEVRRSLILNPVSAKSAPVTAFIGEEAQKKTDELALTAQGGSDISEVVVEETTPTSFLSGLTKSRRGLLERIKGIFSGSTIQPEHLDDLQAQLIAADLGPKVVQRLRATIENELKNQPQVSEEKLSELFAAEIEKILVAEAAVAGEPQVQHPLVVLIVGVNGVGKTTTVAKLAKRYKNEGKKVLLVAADTFRAAAVEQLQVWGQRLGISVCSGAENAKPQTVVFDAAQRAISEQFDVVLIDTAGRLHNKANLMQELSGVNNAISRHIPGAPHETLLVIDGTTGQNALQQAKEFNESVKLSGIIVTKLDGTAKGGVVVAVSDMLQLPVRYVGLGEKENDLVTFNSKEFAEALFIDKAA